MSAADDASLAASLFAVDPAGTGGVCVRSPVSPARDQWLALLRDLLPPETALRRIPFNIADGRLLGGLDLIATLKANRPIGESGVLAMSDGGVVVVAMAERLTPHTAACLNQVLDAGEISMSREGVSIRNSARVGIVALDEGMSPDEFVPESLRDRLAFLLDFGAMDMRTLMTPSHDADDIARARRALPDVDMDSDVIKAVCAAALALGAGSPRVSVLALRVARASAALEGRRRVSQDDAAIAARLVLAPRATILPAAAAEPPMPDAEPESESESESQPESKAENRAEPQREPAPETAPETSVLQVEVNAQQLEDLVLAAATAAIPEGLLNQLRANALERSAGSGGQGRAGALRNARGRGRPAGVRSGMPGSARLSVIETLRAAAPWQRLRGRGQDGDVRIRVEAGDFRVTRYKQRACTLTIFAVDASGSSALNRLAEAKGAVELLLADCYIRRDQVAVIAFRGRSAELLLPPTRSLVRAKRSLASLPGGGATPLAAAIEAAVSLALQAQRRGETPTLVMLSDGRANVARSGATGRDAGQADALKCAGAVRSANLLTVFVDTSPRPNSLAGELARRMGAKYIPLPFADARSLSKIVSAAAPRSLAVARQ